MSLKVRYMQKSQYRPRPNKPHARGAIGNFSKRDLSSLICDGDQQPIFSTPGVALYHADCLDFLRSLPEASVDLIVTDPAYSGMNNKLNFGRGRIVGLYKQENNGKWFPEFRDDPVTFRKFLEECNRVLKNNRHIYIMSDSFSLLSLGPIIREVFNMKNILVWDKVNIGMGHYFRRRHEFILFATKGERKLSSRDIPDIWQVKRIIRGLYPAQKPVEIFEKMIKASAEQGFIVCDPFMGSGSSGIAALKHHCGFIGADISRRACQVSESRIRHFLEAEQDWSDSAAVSRHSAAQPSLF